MQSSVFNVAKQLVTVKSCGIQPLRRYDGRHRLNFPGRQPAGRIRASAKRNLLIFVILAGVICGICLPACVSQMPPNFHSRMERERKLQWLAVELSGEKRPEKSILETANHLAQKNNISLRLVDISNARFETGECLVLFKTFEMVMQEKTPLLVEYSPEFARQNDVYILFSDGSFDKKHATVDQLKELKNNLTPSSAKEWVTNLALSVR